MKKFIQGLGLGIILTAVVLTPIQTFAKSGKYNLEAYYNNIKVMVNGNYVNLSSSNGDSVEPFIVDGTTYLPVGAIADALGVPVGWDNVSNTVILGNKPDGQGTSLTELGIFSGDYSSYSFKTFDTFETNIGKKYYDGYIFSEYHSEADATFLLNGQYDSFDFTLAPYKTCKGEDERNLFLYNDWSFRVYGDDVLLYELDELPSDLITPINVSLDVENVVRLKIVAPSYNTTYVYGILDPTLR